MTQSTAIDHRLNLLRRHWKSHPQPPTRAPQSDAPRPLLVAISREAGAPGLEVGREIGARLHWPVYDREIIEMVAQESGLRSELLETVDERDRDWLVEAIASFKRRGEINTATFVHHLVSVMSALAVHGRCVVVGRGGRAFLPRSATLRVRVVADLGDRVHRTAVERGMTEDEALHAVEQVDRERAKFVAHHFHRDINDPHNFDLVLNASRLPIAMCADLAVSALRAFSPHGAAGEQRPAETAAASH
jgi:cytidylate kinase